MKWNLDTLRETTEKATLGEWCKLRSPLGSEEPWCITGYGGYGAIGYMAKEADADFVCMARWAVPMLLRDHETMHKALEQIAKNTVPRPPASVQFGSGPPGPMTVWGAMMKVAREALEAVDKPEQPKPDPLQSSEERLAQRVADILVERCAILVQQPGESVKKGKGRRKR